MRGVTCEARLLYKATWRAGEGAATRRALRAEPAVMRPREACRTALKPLSAPLLGAMLTLAPRIPQEPIRRACV
eukprot:6936798-Prymnesium_polylepis.1